MKSRDLTTRRKTAALAAAAVLAALVVVVAHGQATAQDPPAPALTLVNADREFVERKKKGEFIARPVFSAQLDVLFYGLRDGETGDWLTSMYRIQGGEKRLAHGWEYTFEYPALDDHPDLAPERVYLMVMLAATPDSEGPTDFYTVVPVHQPTGLWDRVLGALDPERWARAFAGWIVQAAHGFLCGVVDRAGGGGAACRREISA